MSLDNLMKTDLMRYKESCEDFIEENLITDFLHVVKKGKEGVITCCRAHPDLGMDLLAVKLYREEKFRNFKRDGVYKQGRVWDKRMKRAIDKKSRKAQETEREIWVTTEFGALETLHSLELNVPEPFACTDDALAMEFLGLNEEPAPMLRQVQFESASAAKRCFDRIIDMVDIMLRNRIVHGDLSAYNILYHEGVPWLIDFPQAVDPRVNPHGFKILWRDLKTIVEYFQRYGLDYNVLDLAKSLWEPVYGPIQC